MMVHDLAHSTFATRLRAAGSALDDRSCRRLVLRYARLYQDVYWFDLVENVLVALELVDRGDAHLAEARTLVQADIEDALFEYCISLNEVAAALHRLLDARPLGPDDVMTCIDHLWNAHACNKSAGEFSSREDAALCRLLAEALA